MASAEAAADPSGADSSSESGERDRVGDCLRHFSPRENPIEFINLLAMTSLWIGILLLAVGFIVPRDYTFDPNMDARDMEAIGLRYHTLAWRLDVCILCGMLLITIGAVLLGCILWYMVCYEGICMSSKNDVESERINLRSTESSRQGAGTYGTSSVPD